MLMNALKLAAPLQPLQKLMKTVEFPTDPEEFRKFMENHKDTIQQVNEPREKNEIGNGFKMVFPNDKFPVYQTVLNTLLSMSTRATLDFNLPIM